MRSIDNSKIFTSFFKSDNSLLSCAKNDASVQMGLHCDSHLSVHDFSHGTNEYELLNQFPPFLVFRLLRLRRVPPL